MSEMKKNSAFVFLLWSTIAGKISFFTSAVLIARVLSPVDFAIIDTILAGGIGGLVLGICLLKLHKIEKIALAGFVAVPIGFWGAFLLAGGLDFIFLLAGVNSEDPTISSRVNVLAIIFMGIICGMIFGAILYGRKSIWLFAAVCGVISFPCGILVGLFNSGHPIKATLETVLAVFGPIDLNLLTIITSFGIGIGFSIGLYEKRHYFLNSTKVGRSSKTRARV